MRFRPHFRCSHSINATWCSSSFVNMHMIILNSSLIGIHVLWCLLLHMHTYGTKGWFCLISSASIIFQIAFVLKHQTSNTSHIYIILELFPFLLLLLLLGMRQQVFNVLGHKARSGLLESSTALNWVQNVNTRLKY